MAGQTQEDSRLARRVQVLVEESERMARILEEFLSFSRPVTDLSLDRVHLDQLARAVISLHEGLASERQITLILDAHDETSLECDPRKIKQVLINILGNALDMAPDGSTITISIAANDHHVTLTIDDEGPGLSDALATRVFEPGVTTKGGGAGLGLTIARGIVSQHHGTLTLRNREDQPGSRAALELPISRVRPPRLADGVSNQDRTFAGDADGPTSV